MMVIMLALCSGFCRFFFKFSDTKSPPASDTVFSDNPYSEKMTSHARIKLPANKLSLFLMKWNLMGISTMQIKC